MLEFKINTKKKEGWLQNITNLEEKIHTDVCNIWMNHKYEVKRMMVDICPEVVHFFYMELHIAIRSPT